MKKFVCCLLCLCLICLGPVIASAGGSGENGTVKPYTAAEAEAVAERVRRVQNDRSVTMINVSDVHLLYGNDAIRNALEDMADGVAELRRILDIDFCVFHGDQIYRMNGYADYSRGIEEHKEAAQILSRAFGDAPQIRMVGNHDVNCANADRILMPADELYAYTGAYTNIPLVYNENDPNGAAGKQYGYFDDEQNRIRFIVLDTSYYTASTVSRSDTYGGFGAVQAQWLCGALDLSLKEDAGEWQIVLLSHIRLDSTKYSRLHPQTAILYAYENGEPVSYRLDEETVEYDFSGKNAAKLALCIVGHAHFYGCDQMKLMIGGDAAAVLEVPVIYVPNAVNARDYETALVGKTFSKKAGTRESTSFVVTTVDRTDDTVYMHHFGAGCDFILHYGGTVVEDTAELDPSIIPAAWGSRDRRIATVKNGTVTAVSYGNALVYCYNEDVCECWSLRVRTADD